jgi:hypothetical protein
MTKVGRPPRSSKASGERVEVRLTAAERKAWVRAAGDLSLSDWIRGLCNDAARLGNR